MASDINGKMTEKLLSKTLKSYLLFSVVILLVLAPVFYFFTERLYLDDSDETLILRKNEFIKLTLPSMKESDISIWNKISKDGKIEKSNSISEKDSLYFHSEFDIYTNENEPYHILKSPILIEGKSYSLVLRVNLIETKDLILNIVLLYSIIIILLLTGLYIITKKMSTKLWKPFYNTLNQIEQFELDKDKIPEFTPTSIEEFDRLNNDISKLIEKNSQIFKSQREFVENAAHELQTPLAIFQLTIDSLIQDPKITAEQFEILTKLNNTIVRLKRLNTSLLLLSKIDGNQFVTNEKVNLNEIIFNQMDFFKDQALARTIEIKSDLKENVLLTTNNELTEILISNLYLNAIKHTVQNGSLSIRLTKESLIFSNTGDHISLDTDKLYQRFSKLNPSTHGNGLGLSIIKKIVDQNKWSIHYSFENNQHLFEVKF